MFLARHVCRPMTSASRYNNAVETIRVKARGMRHRVLGGLGYDPEVHDEPSSPDDSGDEAVQNRGKPVRLAQVVEEKNRAKEPFCSYELFCTKNRQVYRNFFNETQKCEPIFYALTWHPEVSTSNQPWPSLLTIESFPCNTLVHCAAAGLKRADAEKILTRVLELDMINIFALEGDLDTDDVGDFAHASDFVTFIRERFGQQFCICVAGYPEMHPRSPTKELDLTYLKAKVDAGADFIITQFFFESRLYIQFVEDCRKIGIKVPIIPGIYPFTNTKLLHRMADICHASIPPWMEEALQQMGTDDEAVRKFGIDLSVKIIKDIRESGTFYGYHLFTLNRSFSALQIHSQTNVQN